MKQGLERRIDSGLLIHLYIYIDHIAALALGGGQLDRAARLFAGAEKVKNAHPSGPDICTLQVSDHEDNVDACRTALTRLLFASFIAGIHLEDLQCRSPRRRMPYG